MAVCVKRKRFLENLSLLDILDGWVGGWMGKMLVPERVQEAREGWVRLGEGAERLRFGDNGSAQRGSGKRAGGFRRRSATA